MLQNLRPYIETAVAAYWAADWLTGLDTYTAAISFIKSAAGW